MRLMWVVAFVLLGFAVTGAVVLSDRVDRLEARVQELEVE